MTPGKTLKNRFGIKKDRVHLKGLVVPSTWDESGNVTGISLSTFDEKIYSIDNNGKGRELLGFIRKGVKIEGTVIYEERGKKLNVKDFIRLKSG